MKWICCHYCWELEPRPIPAHCLHVQTLLDKAAETAANNTDVGHDMGEDVADYIRSLTLGDDD